MTAQATGRRGERTGRISRHYCGALVAIGLLMGPGAGWVLAQQAVTPVVAGAAANPPAVKAAEPVMGPVAQAVMPAQGTGVPPQAAMPVPIKPVPELPKAVEAVKPLEAPAVAPKVVEAPKVDVPQVDVPKAAEPVVTPVKAAEAVKPAVASQPVATTAKVASSMPAEPLPVLPASEAHAIEADGQPFVVTKIELSYAKPAKGLPAVEELLSSPVKLGLTSEGFVAPRSGVPTATVKIGNIGRVPPQKVYTEGVRAIYEGLTRALNQRGVIGVFVVADPQDIVLNENKQDQDLRSEDKTLRIVIYTTEVKEVRTVATGASGGASGGERVNLPRQEAIRKNSPVKAKEGENVLRKEPLDDYVLWLNRHPGRRVDVAVSGSDTPGEATLDYLVAENRPWYVYAQVSNTGTKQTELWRERFGGVHNQLTGHDDILSLDYVTAGFDKSHAFVGSYEFPIPGLDRVRNNVNGSWSAFTASDVGISTQNFTGDSWQVGDFVSWNFFQYRDLFVDLLVGARFQGVTVEDQTFNNTGSGDYTLPFGGLRMERGTDTYATNAELTLMGGLASNNQDELDALGRSDVTDNWVILQGAASHSFFLEPLLAPGEFSRGSGTLAHEVFFSARGQAAFDQRLIPQMQQVAGGLYTVRGYPESIAAGDSVIVATAEYRFHLPRILGVQTDPNKTKLLGEPFRFSPQQPYGRPDWDLIARAFFDVGRTWNSNLQVGTESNQTLMGTGVGLEFQFKQYLNVRVDWGVALDSIPEQVSAGSNRFHIVATLMY